MTELTIRSELPLPGCQAVTGVDLRLLAAPALLASRAPSSMGSLEELRSEPKADSRPPTPGTKVTTSRMSVDLRLFDLSRANLRGVPSRDLRGEDFES